MNRQTKKQQKRDAALIKKRKRKKRRLKILFTLEILFFLGIILFGLYYFFFSKMQQGDINMDNVIVNDIDNADMNGYRNIALFGVDSQTNQLGKGNRSDALMVASINKKTKDVKILSIYRDTYVNVDGHGLTKITHAYAYGGPELAVSTINQNLDLNIQEYVTVNFKALANTVDLLGGVDIEVKSYELKNLNAYIGNMNKINGGNSPKIQNAGMQTLDGNQAVAYSRIRYAGNGDYERTERQRAVLEQILVKAKKSNPVTIVKIVNDVFPQIMTNLSSTDVLGLAKDVFSYDIEETEGFPFDNKGQKIGGVFYGVPITLESNVVKTHKFLFGTDGYDPSRTVKDISNKM